MGTTLMDGPGERPRAEKGTTVMGGATGGGTRLVSPEGIGKSISAESFDPVVAWLAVIAGPGRGKAVKLGYGMNIIGRGGNNRVVIDFGDDQISEDDHFRIAYDAENREFHLVPGRGTNLVRVAGKPLLSAQILTNGTDFKIGATVLRFIALCSSEWDWGDSDGEPG